VMRQTGRRQTGGREVGGDDEAGRLGEALSAVFFSVVRIIISLTCMFVLCLILVPLPPGKNPIAVQLNNNNKQ
jgi:hypothetical protein